VTAQANLLSLGISTGSLPRQPRLGARICEGASRPSAHGTRERAEAHYVGTALSGRCLELRMGDYPHEDGRFLDCINL
jgi:hypothetical protein